MLKALFAIALLITMTGAVLFSSTNTAHAAAPADLPSSACNMSQIAKNDSREAYRNDRRMTGNRRALVLFADFPDAPGTWDTKALFEQDMPAVADWYGAQSRGLLTLRISSRPGWIQLSKPLAGYRVTSVGRIDYDARSAVAEALQKAANDTDLSGLDVVYVYVPPGWDDPSVSLGAPVTFTDKIGSKRSVSAILLTSGNTPGVTIPVVPSTIVHETGHALGGMPDLYILDSNNWPVAASEGPSGSWDLMGANTPSGRLDPLAMYFSWHQYLFGWLQPNQMRCLGSGTTEATIVPLSTSGTGLQMIAIPVSPTENYVVETRDRTSLKCPSGVLISLVTTNVPDRQTAAVRVQQANKSSSRQLNNQCGYLYNALYNPATTTSARFEDRERGVTVEVLGGDGDGFNVRVIRQGPSKEAAVTPTPPVSQGSIDSPRVVFSKAGMAQKVFLGGSVDDLEKSAARDGAKGVWAQDSRGNFELLVINGPAFINSNFRVAFAGGFSGPVSVTLTQ